MEARDPLGTTARSGVELKENIRRQWWKSMVTSRDDVVGLDSSIILPRETWVASGHVGTFTDPLVECLNCHKRRRQDHLQEALAAKKGIDDPDSIEMTEIVCPDCGTKGQWTAPREFNMMLKTFLGVIEDESGLHYLRPETAQGIFINFHNVMQASRKKPPFGIAQTGKSFRNEITPATSSSAPASSSRWRWSSSSSPARTTSGSSTGSTSAPAGTPTSASTPTTCGTTSTRPRSSRTTPSAPSTSSTASTSPAPSGASSRASPTALTST